MLQLVATASISFGLASDQNDDLLLVVAEGGSGCGNGWCLCEATAYAARTARADRP